MVQIEYIRWLYYQQHQSIRAIARKLGHSRKTVRKVLALEDPREHKYPRGLPKPRPVMGPVEHIIEAWLREDENKPRKQRYTARRIYQEQSLRRRLKSARFPFVKGLKDYDFTVMPSLNKNKVLALSQGEFIARRETVIFVGNCGTGKTHLAIALGLCALRKGYKVAFTPPRAWPTNFWRRNRNIGCKRLRSSGWPMTWLFWTR